MQVDLLEYLKIFPKILIVNITTIVKKHAVKSFHLFIRNHDLSQYGQSNTYALLFYSVSYNFET